MTDRDTERSLAATLFDTVTALQRHVAERAEEIAEPRIAAYEEACKTTVDNLIHSHAVQQERFDRVLAECHRVLDVRDNQIARYRQMLKSHGIDPSTGLAETPRAGERT